MAFVLGERVGGDFLVRGVGWSVSVEEVHIPPAPAAGVVIAPVAAAA